MTTTPPIAIPPCIVLCGGLGTRLASVVSGRPKALAPVAGRPFLEWILNGLRLQGVTAVTLATGPLGEMIEQRFGTGASLGLSINYSRESRALGTGGAARLALQQTAGATVLVLNGDTYAEFSVAALSARHLARAARLTMAIARVPDATRFGVVESLNDGSVSAYRSVGTEGSAWVSAGAYLLNRELLEHFPPDRPFSFEDDVIPAFVGSGLQAVKVEGAFIDIGTPDSWRGAATQMKRLINAVTSADTVAKTESVTRRLELSLSVKKSAIINCVPDMIAAANLISECFASGGKLLICGNGGSAADAQHVAAEFVSRLRKDVERQALPALALTTDTSFLSAYANDYNWEGVFARQVEAFGRGGDVLLGISTSGSSANVLRGLATARDRGVHTIALVGEGGSMPSVADVAIVIPSTHTGAVQETMLAIEHTICELVEDTLFRRPGSPADAERPPESRD